MASVLAQHLPAHGKWIHKFIVLLCLCVKLFLYLLNGFIWTHEFSHSASPNSLPHPAGWSWLRLKHHNPTDIQHTHIFPQELSFREEDDTKICCRKHGGQKLLHITAQNKESFLSRRVRSCLTNLPLNFLGGLLRSPASGCTTHRSSTRLQRNEQWSEIPSPCSPLHPRQQNQSRSLAIFHPSGHFSRRHSPNANWCQIFLRSMQLIFTVAQSYAPGRWDNKSVIAPVFCIAFMSPARGADRTAHILGRWQTASGQLLPLGQIWVTLQMCLYE